MRRQISYATYLDKVRGCFLGKTVIGTLGAPYEGVKMPMELSFRPEMVNTMLPNDDLDLQVLWLDVVEKYGVNFTAAMLQKAFVENCDYSPGEYAIMRKNYGKGIYPPYSGMFCNDFYIEGMGCPIRSEIWACLAPGNTEMAAEFSSRDGILDHKGESVYAERFFAAMEAEAFFENDLNKLIDAGLSVIPENCRFRGLVEDVRAFCRKYNNIKDVLAEILFKYGHPDCTNMFQNMGITLASLVYGEYDLLKTGMIALNCGFDTDCTCASAGALVGIILGEKEIQKQYGWGDIKYVLSVRSDRRSDLVSDLSEDVALLGARLARDIKDAADITDAPVKEFAFESIPKITFRADYLNEDPSIGINKNCFVDIAVINNTDSDISFNSAEFTLPANIIAKSGNMGAFRVVSGGETIIKAEFALSPDCDTIFEKNIIKLSVKGEDKAYDAEFEFGVSGNKLWKLTGPIWKTDPVTDENILGDKSYFCVFRPSKTKAEETDQIRHFHLNFAVDTKTDYFTEEELFAPVPRSEDGSEIGSKVSRGGETLIARPYKETLIQTSADGFTMDSLMGFSGPCVSYLSQILIAPEDRTVCIQLGHSAPFKLFINGELIGSRDNCDRWTSENAHFDEVKLKKGENKIVLRLTSVNADAKFSMIFSDGMTCSTHYFDFATKLISE